MSAGDVLRSLKRLKRRIALRFLAPYRARRAVAKRHLAPGGTGADLGPLHLPFPLPPGVRVINVDYLTRPALAARYPEVDATLLAPVHLVDSAEALASVRTGSLDFLVASHVIEHMEDPITALGAWLRVVRPGGTVLLVVPDRRHTFDRAREPTTWEHLQSDHLRGAEASRRGHYEEWARQVDRIPEPQVERTVASLMAARYSIHFHVWDPPELERFLERARPYLPPFSVKHFEAGSREILVVLEKDG